MSLRGTVILLLVLMVCGLGEAWAAREVSERRECSMCHVMWLDTFKRADVATLIPYDPKPVVDTGKQDIVSTERMCLSCHDGFVLDSRFAWANREHFHPVGVKPTKNVQIPTQEGRLIFPMNNEGKVYCGTCHSAHGVDWKQEESPIFLRSKNVQSSMCMACHLERSTGPDEGNHPVFRELEELPDVLIEAGSKFGKHQEVICQSCHIIHGAGTKEKILAIPNPNSALCGTCHSDRYAKDKAEAGRMGTHPVNITSKKVKIADEIVERGGKLGEGGEIICQTCHKPHYAENKTRILVKNNQTGELCATCHADKGAVAISKHNLALKDKEIKNIRGQAVGTSGVCSSCHVPHGGSSLKMWARERIEGVEPVASLCLSCHSKGRVAENKQVGEHTHPVGNPMSRLGSAVDLPGYTDGVSSVGDKQGVVTCASCHNPHQWDPTDPNKGSKPGDPSNASNRFLRIRNSGTDAPLCRTCHKDKGGIRGTKHDAANMKEVASGANQTNGVCGTCHLVHNGKGPRMWARNLADAPDQISAACLGCHNKDGLGKKKTIGEHSHPVGVSVSRLGIVVGANGWSIEGGTGSQNGQDGKPNPLPLFDEQGRKAYNNDKVTCATCHDPHNWSAGRAGAGSPLSEGDGNTSFLRIPNDAKAGLCTNCHVDKRPVALTKHNLAITAPEAKNSIGQAAKDIAVCINCHVPHNAGAYNLWGRGFGPGGDKTEAMCRECHREGGVAQAKLTGANSHPLQVDVMAVGGTVALPFFNAEGARTDSKKGGRVSCPSCHNPHQWDPADPTSKEGADAKVEGTAKNSFLRKPASDGADLCVECHDDQKWVRKTDHDMRVTGPQERNGNGELVQDSGVCQQCHSVHNAKQAVRLWGKPLGEGQDPNEQMCRGCHDTGKVAAAKIPVKKNHPAKVQAQVLEARARRGPVRGFTPLFDAEGKVANTGVISCPTCHNPHRWDALGLEQGTGENLEGNARNSFLRNRSKLSLCSNCHGMDALFRYKYFHGETSRKEHELYR